MTFSTPKRLWLWPLALCALSYHALQVQALPEQRVLVTAAPLHKQFENGKAILVTLRIVNKSNADIQGSFDMPNVRLFTRPTKKLQLKQGMNAPLANQASHRFVPLTIKHGQSHRTQIDLRDYIQFKKPGTYLVRYALLFDYWKVGHASSANRKLDTIVKRGTLRITLEEPAAKPTT